ncbi:MAG TPA: nucleoside deaminase [Motiliproteus sp.]
MKKQPTTIAFDLPDWIDGFCEAYQTTASHTARMQFVINAARENVARKTGGPFAAAIFRQDTGELVALGVNLVTSAGLSILHAEMVAIAVAQTRIGHYDLGADPAVHYELVTSTEPCSMCFGAIPWSGVRSVVTGAMDADARRIGFDEGPKPDDWVGALTSRGIRVIEQVERADAAQVLVDYLNQNGHIYNSREG